MSNFGFGEDEEIELQTQNSQGPKWFRERMDEVSETLKGLKAENERLKEGQRRTQIQEVLTAKGYAPQAAGLYTGPPEKLDDWLGANGAALAKVGDAAEQGQGVQSTQSVIPAESQAAQVVFSAAGMDGAPALGTEEQLAARMNAAQTEEEFAAIMREAGNRRF